MFDRVRFAGRHGEQFILTHTHALEKSPSSVRLAKLEPHAAARAVRAALMDAYGNPHWQLLELLGVEEHPYNLRPGALDAVVLRQFGDSHLARFVVYQEFFVGSAARIERSRPAPVGEPLTDTPQPATFIVVETVDDHGAAVSGVRLEIVLPDGETRTAVTGSDGRSVLDLPTRGTCRIRLPHCDGRAWRPLEGAPKSATREAAVAPTRRYLVQQGDTLSAIAHRHGLHEWKQVWDHPDNAPLRAKRKSPHVLHPGDSVVVPSPTVEEIARETAATHRIEVVRPRVELTVILGDHHGRPFKNQPYEVRLGRAAAKEVLLRGTTDGEGLVKGLLPAGTREVFVTLTRQGVTWPIVLGAVLGLPESASAAHDEGGTVRDEAARALQSRLNALGIPSGPANGAFNAKTQLALLHLRRARGDTSSAPLCDDDLKALERFGV